MGTTRLVLFGLIYMGLLGSVATASPSDDPAATSPVEDGNDLKMRFNSLARRAQMVEKSDGKDAAVYFYREALDDPSFENFGLIHLRLAQLLAQLNDTAGAAFHFVACHRDRRVEQVDRQVICWQGFKDATAVLNIRDLPDDGRVSVLEPEEFAGPFESGGRLPKGRLRLLVEVPKRRPHTSGIDLSTDRTWHAELGMTKPEGPMVPTGFIEGAQPLEKPKIEKDKGSIVLPTLVSILGAATLAYGAYSGLEMQSELDDVRAREASGRCRANTCPFELDNLAQDANLSDGLLVGGAVVTSVGFSWLWYVLNDAEKED